MEGQIQAVTEYRGWRIVFDGRFALIDESGRVVGKDLDISMYWAKYAVGMISVTRQLKRMGYL